MLSSATLRHIGNSQANRGIAEHYVAFGIVALAPNLGKQVRINFRLTVVRIQLVREIRAEDRITFVEIPDGMTDGAAAHHASEIVLEADDLIAARSAQRPGPGALNVSDAGESSCRQHLLR